MLGLRKARPGWFDGAYRRLPVDGPRADRVIAYARGDDLAVIVPRLTAVPAPGWADTRIALDGAWEDALTGARVEGATSPERLWARFPVALLMRSGRA